MITAIVVSQPTPLAPQIYFLISHLAWICLVLEIWVALTPMVIRDISVPNILVRSCASLVCIATAVAAPTCEIESCSYSQSGQQINLSIKII